MLKNQNLEFNNDGGGFLFDINGRIGRGAYGIPEFPSARDLLAHMDYLGIDRALVWHVLARDLSPVAGNRCLLKELDSAEEFRRRLVPAQVITPANAYEYGAITHIREMARKGGSPAFRIFPKTSRFNILNMEKLLAAIADLKPVVFWDFKDSNGRTDALELRELAAAFPHCKFALTELMWQHFHDAVELMHKCANVSMDISWLHMRDSIELLVEEFGPERILFGAGFKSHYGASIAALNHARISENARELIAHGNAERMLGLPPLRAKLVVMPEILKKKPLWSELRAGRPVTGAEIIDIHTHTVPFTRGWIIRDIDLKDFMPNIISQMDRHGVSRCVMIPESALFGDPVVGNRETEEALAAYRRRISGWLVFNPLYGDELVRELDGFFARGFFIGFKILPSYWKRVVTDAGYLPVWEYADRHHLPILVHAWDDKYNSPALLTEIVAKYRGAVFVIGHSGGGTAGRAEAVTLARNNPNVLLEFCGSFTTSVDWVDTIAQVGNDRIAFGSDTGGHNQAWELGRLLSIPLPDKELAPMLAENFKKLTRGL